MVKPKRLLLTLGILSSSIGLAAAYANTPQWNLHHDTYLGARIGFNFSDVTFENSSSDRHGTVMQELMGGYYFTPNWALETGVGSYFSSLGLGIRLGLKASLPLGNRWNLSLQAGGNYISSFLQNGLIGPYISGGIEYSLNQHATLNLDANDLLLHTSMQFSDQTLTFSGNVFSMVLGFNYYL